MESWMMYVAESMRLSPQGMYLTQGWAELAYGSDVRDFDANAIVDDMIRRLAGDDR